MKQVIESHRDERDLSQSQFKAVSTLRRRIAQMIPVNDKGKPIASTPGAVSGIPGGDKRSPCHGAVRAPGPLG